MNAEELKTWLKLFFTLNEAQRRWASAQKSIELGYGGIEKIHKITGISRTTIIRGRKELMDNSKKILEEKAIRSPGGGRKTVDFHDPELRINLKKILDETTIGDPMTPLLWTSKSCRTIASELTASGCKVSYRTVWKLLVEEGYSLQANRKDLEATSSHPDRDKQFQKICKTVTSFIKKGNPVISVDAKKKEDIGNFKNNGRVWADKGKGKKVGAYDFPSLSEGTAIPYGTYDVGRNEGFVNIGISHDTAEFAVQSILTCWNNVGKKNYSNAKELLICADSGGSNGASNRLWKAELQNFSDKTSLKVSICHYPPGTSKWNKIEHKMFSFISINWRGKPLESYQTVINLIGSTKTKNGLKIRAKLDKRMYNTGIEISNEEMEHLLIAYNSSLPKWNYTISPRI